MNYVFEQGMEAGINRLASRLLRKTDFDLDVLDAVVEDTIKELQKEAGIAEIEAELNPSTAKI